MATMEDLTKTQIVLLTLLISFITSIGTGIITTALLAEAPAGVTQTINRVVEHTIEKVVSATPTSTPDVVREVTVVKEEDAILSSIDKTTQSVVKINFRGGDGNDVFYALGTIVSKDGYVISDGANLILDGTYTATINGVRIPAAVVSRSSDQSLAIFRLTSGDPKQTYNVMALAPNDPQPGQSVIAIEGKTNLSVAVGRVTSVTTPDGGSVAKSVETDIPAKNETTGGPLINLSGELVGLKSSSPDATLPAGLYTALAEIKAFLQNPNGR